MTEDQGPEAMVDACIAAFEAVKKHGTSEMLLVARILLQMAGEQIAQDLQSPITQAVKENSA
ncbi:MULTISPECIES: hypothetical protein [unclassified Methylobacterium]|uniref:hypothetical protein n=1 Tax=unclassified Methylobacterium TaxID=2615210 RepID=UPI00226A2837|nr:MULTISPECIES: hypothetical protein [unclassified Methylobacterium]